ncbi:MAG: hypothetical protein N2255_05615 [Kiritimatiellae bacterium]|nr:hypothetical protein [Kiritimatiellia bacterium]
MRPFWLVTFSALLLVFSGAGVIHGVRAGRAQVLYHDAKYSIAAHEPDGILRRCEVAQKLYPFNYYFHIWAAENAWRAYLGAAANEGRTRWLEAARFWCDTGLACNPYRSELRTLKMRLLAMDSVEEAIRYWRSYLDWHFWEPYNHALMVELYAKAGDFERAVAEMRWVRGSRHYEDARRILDEAWAREVRFPGSSKAR